MKKLSFYLWVALAGTVVFFSSCEKEDDKQKEVLVSFENVMLNNDGTLKNASFDDGGMTFTNFYYEDYNGFSGFACSSKTDKTIADFTNDLSVYGNGGASGTKFAVFYYDSYNVEQGNISYCSFSDNVARTIKELKVTNSTYTYLTIKNGNGFSEPFSNGDYFKLTITGYNDNTITGSVDFYLADFQNGKSYICDTWTSVNLEKLGKVSHLGFSFVSTDTGEWGINTPQYACIDDIIYYAK